MYAGLRPRNLDVKALQAVFELLQSHYPERLHALWFLNAPFIFWGVWRMVSLLCNIHRLRSHQAVGSCKILNLLI